ncbi:MAG: sulfatase [Bacteroidota bacterium]
MSKAENETPLNIVWIVNEDMGSYLPSFGDSTVVTPNLSRLAAEGICYTNVYSPSGVCAPSRAALSLGMYPSGVAANHMRTGGNPKYFPQGVIPYEAMPPAEVKMHGERLREAGYYCTNNSKEDYQYKKSLMGWDESSRKAHWRNREKGQPFFAIFNIGVTHESQIWAKANDSLWIPKDLDVPIPPYLPDNAIGQTDVRRMYSNIKEMDAEAGKILAQLEEDGLMDKTVIFFYSDHGGPLPRQKRLCYDSGLKVPMIIRFPDKKGAGTYDDQLLSFIDFKPTIMSLAGIQPPEVLDGKAFLGTYKVETPRKYIHAAGDRFDAQYDMIRAVRDKQFKYMRNFQPEKSYYLPVKYRENMPIMQELLRMRDEGELNTYQAQWFRETKVQEELFDCDNDPHELHNLADDPAYADKLAELRAECDRWMAEIKDVGEIPEADLIASIWPGNIQPQAAAPTISKEGKQIILSSETEGASIGFQLLGPNEKASKRWQIYRGPIDLKKGQRLLAIADRIGYKPSEVVEEE